MHVTVKCLGRILCYVQNGHNSGGQQLPTLLDLTSCACLHTLLLVVESCCSKFETGQTLSYVQMDATTPNNVPSVCTGLYI